MLDETLAVSGLRKRYGDRHALRGVDLVVRPGEVHGLLGPNGAGKTTLMRIVLGLVAPDAGAVRIFGEPATIPGPPPATVSGFADMPRFYPYLSGRKNLRILARLDGAARDVDERVTEALARVALADDADAKVGAYSAGMRQRLALAAALLRSPKLILLDEPTSSLDPAGARDLRSLVMRLSADGVAVLLSSHHLGEVQDLCARVTILRRGVVAFAGTLTELRGRAPSAVRRLRTSDDARALDLAPSGVGVSAATDAQGLDVSASDEDLDAYVLRLGHEGVAVRHLESDDRRLESVFLKLTTGDAGDAPAASAATEGAPSDAPRDPWTLKGTAAVARVEVMKLAAQAKVWATLGACVLGPFAFAMAMITQSSLPEDTLLGRSAKASGFATPAVILGFATMWALPVLASVVGGDVFSSEDRYGTWPTILSRSRSRAEIFAGKVLVALAFAAAVVIALGLASIAAGVLVVGRQPLLGLSGTELAPSQALAMVSAAWGSALPPVLAFSAMAVLASVATRSSVAGVGLPVLAAFGMQLAAFLDHPQLLHHLLLPTAFDAWHGLLSKPVVTSQLEGAAALSGAYLAACLALARSVFAKRSTLALAVVAAILLVVAVRSSDDGITRGRLESTVAGTFGNLVALQVARIGGPAVDAWELEASAQCTKSAAPTERRGAGEWACDVVWRVPSRNIPLHDRYELHVTPDGCYVAAADGEEAHVGGPTITTRGGKTTRNLLYTFEGCLGGP